MSGESHTTLLPVVIDLGAGQKARPGDAHSAQSKSADSMLYVLVDSISRFAPT